MKISVIIPVYNCADYVERCIRSIMAQTYSNLEIICIDDGSTDESGNILDTLALEDSRIRVVHQKNAGASAARNAGIKMVTGDLVTFIDSDDAIEPNMYETLLVFFADPDIDIVHCGYKRISQNGAVKDVNGTGKVVKQDSFEAVNCLLSGCLFVGSLWNKLYRIKLLEEVQLDPGLIINEDVLVNVELFLKSKYSVYIDTGKYLFYERAGSVTTGTKLYKKLVDCAVAARKMVQLCRNTPAEPSATERLVNAEIALYRWYVMNPAVESKREKEQLSKSIDGILEKSGVISSKQKLNYRLMRSLPWFYCVAYRIYDKIRVPDWDVKVE